MNAAGIITYARGLCGGVSTQQLSDTVMVSILNKSYRDFYKRIVSLDKNYFWDKRTSDLKEDQYEYGIQQPSAGTWGMFKPENIRVKYVTTDDYVDVFLTDRDSLDNTPERYAVNQDTVEPFAILTDNKYIHLFPTPTADCAGGILFEGAKKPYDLTISSTANDILIDALYHEVLAYMMVPEIEVRRSNFAAKNITQQDSEIEQMKALRSMGVLKTKAIKAKTKDLSDLE